MSGICWHVHVAKRAEHPRAGPSDDEPCGERTVVYGVRGARSRSAVCALSSRRASERRVY